LAVFGLFTKPSIFAFNKFHKAEASFSIKPAQFQAGGWAETLFIVQLSKSQESKTGLDYRWANCYLTRLNFWKGTDTLN